MGEILILILLLKLLLIFGLFSAVFNLYTFPTFFLFISISVSSDSKVYFVFLTLKIFSKKVFLLFLGLF